MVSTASSTALVWTPSLRDMARATTDSYGHTLSTQFPAKLRVTTERAGQLTQYAPRDSVGRKRADHIRAWRNDFAARAGRGAQVHKRARAPWGACLRTRAHARSHAPLRARARTRAPSFVPPSRTALHLNGLFILPASASSFPPYPTPSRTARSRPRANILHCAGLQGCEPNTSPPPPPTCYARAIPRHLMPSGFLPLTMRGKALVSMRLVCQTGGASLTRRMARRRRRYSWTRKATLHTTALPVHNQSVAWRCGNCSVDKSRGFAFTFPRASTSAAAT